jgi:hypothetical protein
MTAIGVANGPKKVPTPIYLGPSLRLLARGQATKVDLYQLQGPHEFLNPYNLPCAHTQTILARPRCIDTMAVSIFN